MDNTAGDNYLENLNFSKISLDDSNQIDINPTRSAVFGMDKMVQSKVGLFSSVCRSVNHQSLYIEIPPNKDKLLYDKANELIK